MAHSLLQSYSVQVLFFIMHLTCVFESLPQQQKDAEIKDLSEIFHCVFNHEIGLVNQNMLTLSLIKMCWSSGFCPLRKKKIREGWHNSRGAMSQYFIVQPLCSDLCV